MRGNYTNIEDFVKEVMRKEAAKLDYLPDTRNIVMLPDNETVELSGVGQFTVNNHAHGQFAEWAGIPKAYYDATASIPGLRAQNLNAWMHDDKHAEKRMIRTLDGRVRANLSKNFKRWDDAFVLEATLPVIRDRKDFELVSCSLTERKLIMQFEFTNFRRELDDPRNGRKGDIISYGATLQNSEVGMGRWSLAAWIKFIWCDNGASRNMIVSQTHLGKANEGDDTDHRILSPAAVQAEMDALRLKVRDNLIYTFTEENYNEEFEKLRAMLNDEVRKPEILVQNVTVKYNDVLNQGDREAILTNMIEEKNMNRYGLLNAITALAKKTEDPVKAYEYEVLGGKIIDLSPKEWAVVADVAA